MSAVDHLKAIAAMPRRGTQCPDCRFFKENDAFRRFSWFGLRKDRTTADSLRFAVCAAHGGHADICREYRCKGEDFEPVTATR